MIVADPRIVNGRIVSYGFFDDSKALLQAYHMRQMGQTLTRQSTLATAAMRYRLGALSKYECINLSYYAANARCPISTRLEARNTRALKGKSVIYPSTVYTVEGMLALMGKPKFTK